MISMAPTASHAALAEPKVRSVGMDEATFNAFYGRTARPLRGYLLRCLGDPALADDLVQETYLRLLRSDLETDDETYRRNYLFRIATNLVRDHFRKRRPERPLPKEGRATPSHQQAVGLRSDVARALTELAPRDRQMLWLAYVEGSSHAEIAESLGLRTASLKSMLFRARARLAERFRGLGLQPTGGEEA